LEVGDVTAQAKQKVGAQCTDALRGVGVADPFHVRREQESALVQKIPGPCEGKTHAGHELVGVTVAKGSCEVVATVDLTEARSGVEYGLMGERFPGEGGVAVFAFPGAKRGEDERFKARTGRSVGRGEGGDALDILAHQGVTTRHQIAVTECEPDRWEGHEQHEDGGPETPTDMREEVELFPRDQTAAGRDLRRGER
jgi:hypothetical protein